MTRGDPLVTQTIDKRSLATEFKLIQKPKLRKVKDDKGLSVHVCT